MDRLSVILPKRQVSSLPFFALSFPSFNLFMGKLPAGVNPVRRGADFVDINETPPFNTPRGCPRGLLYAS
jgi:hypothetical protein